MNERRKWHEYTPTQGVWFWSVAGAAVLTMIVGFGWGGWTTERTAAMQANAAAQQARAELAADVCEHAFLSAPDAAVKLAELKGTSSWKMREFVEKAGWVTMPGSDKPVTGAWKVCADRLMSAELPSGAEDA